MSNHEKLAAWQQAMDLVDAAYELSKRLPREEQYGIAQQLQRAAVSIPANIAEGCGRDSTKDFLRHIAIARGSLAEVATLLEIVRRRKLVESQSIENLKTTVRNVVRLTGGLRASLRRRLDASPSNH